MGKDSQEEQLHLMRMVIEQQKSYIQMQEERLAEKDAAIADLRALVEKLQSLKANLEETLEEFRRQFLACEAKKQKAAPCGRTGRRAAPDRGPQPYMCAQKKESNT